MTMSAPTVRLKTRGGSFVAERVVGPVVAQLKQGTAPDQVALTIALGAMIGIFPILGATTLLCGIVAARLRLNQPIIQMVNYLVYPAQLVLLFPFYRAGETLLGRSHVPMSVPLLIERFLADVGAFFRDFGMAGVGGVGVWCLTAPIAAAALYFTVRPLMRTLAARLQPALPREIILTPRAATEPK